jgi:hypothetical protein
MRNALAGFLASGFAVRRGLQTDLSHLRCPLPVMVRTARRGAMGLLPDMHQLLAICDSHLEKDFIGCRGCCALDFLILAELAVAFLVGYGCGYAEFTRFSNHRKINPRCGCDEHV